MPKITLTIIDEEYGDLTREYQVEDVYEMTNLNQEAESMYDTLKASEEIYL